MIVSTAQFNACRQHFIIISKYYNDMVVIRFGNAVFGIYDWLMSWCVFGQMPFNEFFHILMPLSKTHLTSSVDTWYLSVFKATTTVQIAFVVTY